MVQYARDDTHYLLYIYDKVREALWERGNEQPTQLQVVWQRSKDICLKVKLHLVELPRSEYGLRSTESPLPVLRLLHRHRFFSSLCVWKQLHKLWLICVQSLVSLAKIFGFRCLLAVFWMLALFGLPVLSGVSFPREMLHFQFYWMFLEVQSLAGAAFWDNYIMPVENTVYGSRPCLM